MQKEKEIKVFYCNKREDQNQFIFSEEWKHLECSNIIDEGREAYQLWMGNYVFIKYYVKSEHVYTITEDNRYKINVKYWLCADSLGKESIVVETINPQWGNMYYKLFFISSREMIEYKLNNYIEIRRLELKKLGKSLSEKKDFMQEMSIEIRKMQEKNENKLAY